MLINSKPETTLPSVKNAPELRDGANSGPDVASILEQIGAVRRRTRQVVRPLIMMFLVAFTAQMLMLIGHDKRWQAGFFMFYSSVNLAVVGVSAFFMHKVSKLHAQFAGVDSVPHIGYVIRALSNNLASPDKALVETLITLLYKLKASDAHYLSPANRTVLNYCLTPGNWTEDSGRLKVTDRYRLVFAILKALEQVGDETAVEPVRLLTKYSRQEVCVAAQECLPYLYQRAREQREAYGLLRASDNAATPDVLLRPAVGTADAAPEQLLRAVTNENANRHP